MRRSLTDIADVHGTDKGTVGPSRHWLAHNYTDIYEAYLWPLRDEPINLLEIGLGVPGEAWEAKIAHGRNTTGGASIKTWSEFFPRARIFGIDINPAGFLDSERISTHLVDQGDSRAIDGFLDSIGDLEFDVVIDDGSHRPDHQQISLSRIVPRVRTGGLSFIEDLMSNGRGDGRRNRYSTDGVVNTRRLLKGFQTSGAFEGPHALGDEEFLARHTGHLAFHVPGIRFGVTRGRLRSSRPLRPMPRFAPGTESLCVLQKV